MHKKKSFTLTLILLAIIILAGLLVLRETFSLALFGDDWLEFYRFRYHVGEWSTGEYNILTYFLTPYGAQETVMAALARIFGYNYPLPFYILSFLLRSSVAIVAFFTIKSLTKNLLAAFFAGFIFIVSTIGLDSTNWVFNMTSYASLSAIVFLIFFFIKSQLHRKYVYALIAALFYYLAYLLSPIRIHGLPIFIVGLEMFFILQLLFPSKGKSFEFKKELRIIVFRQLLMLAVLGAIFLTGASQGIGLNLTQRLKEGYETMSFLITKKDFVFLFNPFVILGRFFIPEDVLREILKLSDQLSTLSLIISFILFSPFVLLSLKLKKKNENIFFVGFLLSLAFWIFFIRSLLSQNLVYLDPTFIIPAYFGGFIFIFWVYLLLTNFHKFFSNLLFTSIVWAISGFLFPWLWTPNTLFGTQHRYFIMSSLGISLFLASITLISRQKHTRWIAIFILVLFVSIQVFSTNQYFSYLSEVRNQKLNNKIWLGLTQIEAVGKERGPLLFYFEGENSAVVYYLITFGFPPHMGILYNIKDLGKLPVPLDKWDDVLEAAKTGKNMPAYGYEAKPVSVKNLYAFRLEQEGNLKDITSEKRKDLLAEISEK